MFDNLVESQTDARQAGRNASFLSATGIIFFSLFLGLFVWSLFSFDLGMSGGDDLVLDTLVAPVPVPEPEPPPPPPDEPKEQPKTVEKTDQNIDILKSPTQDIMSTPKEPPKGTETNKQNVDIVRRGVQFAQGDKTTYAEGGSEGAGRGGGTVAIPPPAATPRPTPVDTDEPPPPPTPKPTPKPVPKTISGGVVNSKATNLVKPPYPPAARAVNASGAVNVQVTIDESGNVVSAAATSGHPLLRDAAVRAARSSKFSPTLLSGQAVKVTGVIVYNFTP